MVLIGKEINQKTNVMKTALKINSTIKLAVIAVGITFALASCSNSATVFKGGHKLCPAYSKITKDQMQQVEPSATNNLEQASI